MRLIGSHCIDHFFYFIAYRSREVKEALKPYHIGDFTYYSVDEILKYFAGRRREVFKEFIERNPLQVIEWEPDAKPHTAEDALKIANEMVKRNRARRRREDEEEREKRKEIYQRRKKQDEQTD